MRIVFSELECRGQGGKGGAGCFFSLLILALFGFAAYTLAPPYISHYQLKDAMKEIATLSAAGASLETGAHSGKPPEISDIQNAVLARAKELEIPLRKKDIKVSREATTVFITVSYTIPIELPGHVYDLNFEFSSHN